MKSLGSGSYLSVGSGEGVDVRTCRARVQKNRSVGSELKKRKAKMREEGREKESEEE